MPSSPCSVGLVRTHPQTKPRLDPGYASFPAGLGPVTLVNEMDDKKLLRVLARVAQSLQKKVRESILRFIKILYI